MGLEARKKIMPGRNVSVGGQKSRQRAQKWGEQGTGGGTDESAAYSSSRS